MKNKKVIGIGYDPASDAAPTVVLKGSGSDAEVVLEQARRSPHVPIVSDPQLVEQLYRLPVDAPVGRDLFTAMAALLAHVMRLDFRGGLTRPTTQLAKVAPFASGNEGTSEKAPPATFSNEGHDE